MNPFRLRVPGASAASLLFFLAFQPASAADGVTVFTRWPYPGGLILSESIERRWDVSLAKTELRRRLAQVRYDRLLVIALGSVGDRSDLELIKALESLKLVDLERKWRGEKWLIREESKRVVESSLWATARLGDSDSLRSVAARLSPPDPAEPTFKRADRWKRYEQEMRMAAYIGHASLLPAIHASLISEAKVPFFECLLFRTPPQTAVQTLQRFIPAEEQPDDPTNATRWIQWFRDRHIMAE